MEVVTEQKIVPTLRFREFDGEWKLEKLGNLTEIKSASRVLKNQWTEAGVPFFRTSDVVAEYKSLENTKAYISMELFEELSKKSGRIKKNDLLVTGGGSIGIPYLVRTNEPLYFKDADLLWFKNTDSLSGLYLHTFLSTTIFRKYINSIAHTGTISHYTIAQAKFTPIKLPSKQEQQKIASFLTAVDEKIQLLNRKHELLQDYKKGIMQKIFSQEIRFKDDDGNDYPDWEEKVLDDVFNGIKGKGLSKDKLNEKGENKCILYGELYTIYPEKITNVVNKTNSNEGVNSLIGDLLVPCSTTTTGIDLANVTALNEENVKLGGDISILRGKQKINNIFYAYYLSNYKKFDLAKYGQGSTIVHLYFSHFKKINIDVPSLKEQQKIASFLSSIDTKLESVSQQLQHTKTFKKGLLQQMFV